MEFDKSKSIRGILARDGGSGFRAYRQLTAGDVGFFRWLWLELLTCCLGPLPGAVGIVLRRLLYPTLFRKCGGKVVIGRNCVLRSPYRMTLGDGVVIDDGCLLDARGCHDRGMIIGDRVMINRNASLQSKGGDIVIGDGVSVGSDVHIASWSGVTVGAGSALAGGCAISAGSYVLEDFDKPLAEREAVTGGPVVIGSDVWIASGAVILDGVEIGDKAVVSAGSVVRNRVKERCVVQGNPARGGFEGRS